MARKRIKTLAQEWKVSVEDVLSSCERLRLGHLQSASSLLSAEEAERVKEELSERAHRAALLRRETVVETTTGKVVEKRLTATVVRRRHKEPEREPSEAEQPFYFQVETEVSKEERFVAPFLEEPLQETPKEEPEIPALPVIGAEPATPTTGEAQAASLRTFPPEASAADLAEMTGPPSRLPAAPSEGEPIEVAPEVAESAEAQGPGPKSTAVAPAPAALSVQRAVPAGVSRPQVVDLTGNAHAAAPSLDDGQRGPKVLGKIDLHKQATRPPAPAPRAGAVTRPGPASRAPQFVAPEAPAEAAPPEPEKPWSKGVKKRTVIRKDDMAAEREMRGLRVPKKRRALPGKEQRKTEITTPKASKRVVRVTEGVTVGDLARNMGVKAGELIKKLMELGVMSTLNQVLDLDTATLVASEFGYTVENVAFDVEQALEEGAQEEGGELSSRPPVVTVMGHVDHGKTSLLDAIRHANVTEEEFGGITQHIGAYTVEVKGRTIGFIDTPGHEAFTAMRARGAKVTDIVVLVVAADEGVMPQTVEAINHARAAEVPIIVALNKIDRPEANLDRVKQQLSEHGLIPEDYGGDIITVPVSARTGEGIDRLLEMIQLQADLMELKANFGRPARGTVIESQLDRGRGPLATVLVQEGTLRQGDPFVCGAAYGRVRAMLDHRGQRLSEAGPATPVEIFGLSSVPEPGTPFVALGDEAKARQVAEFRRAKQREGELQKTSRTSLEDLSQRLAAGEVKELKLIVKGDVQGSVEAVSDALGRLSTDEVKVEIIHSSAGAISETDVTLASASKALIVGFNIRPELKAVQLAEKLGVEIRLYPIIYEAVDDIREAMEGLLAPAYREKPLGRAEVRTIFALPGLTVAGSMVVDGRLTRSARVRLMRDGRVVYEGRVASLRRFKEDVREVQAGYECGIALENYSDIKPGDLIEAYETEAVLRKLGAPKTEAVRLQTQPQT